MVAVCVLGAGVVGLSTAVNIQQIDPKARVTIIAEHFNEDTTSYGAAGVLTVSTEKTPGNTRDLRRWLQTSYNWYHDIWRSEETADAGVQRISGFQLWNEEKNKPFHSEFDYSFRKLSDSELSKLPGNHSFGFMLDTLMVECRRYLPWLMNRFQENGGKVISQSIQSLDDIGEGYDVIVNCLGLGSRKIFGDKEVLPIRGHAIRADAQWIKHLYVAGNGDTYIYPGRDSVVLGGTRQAGEWSTEKEQQYFDDILQRCVELVPSLKKAKLLRTWVGLRPYRKCIRLEKEHITINRKIYPVVHNYGHGTNGVALSWGTAVDAAQLVKDVIQGLQRGRQNRQYWDSVKSKL